MRYPRLTSTVVATAAVSLIAVVLAGCGGGGSSSSSSSSSSSANGVASKSATAIFEAAKTAAAGAGSVHIAGSIVSGGKPIGLNMELLSGKGGKGQISQEGFSINLVQVGGSVYMNGSKAFYTHVAGATAAQLLQGKWLKAPANSGELASLASLTDFSKLITSALAHKGTLTKGASTTIEGQPAIALEDSSSGTLYVATTGKPYPLEIAKHGKESGKVLFNRWDGTVTLKAPADAIDISKLQNGH